MVNVPENTRHLPLLEKDHMVKDSILEVQLCKSRFLLPCTGMGNGMILDAAKNRAVGQCDAAFISGASYIHGGSVRMDLPLNAAPPKPVTKDLARVLREISAPSEAK